MVEIKNIHGQVIAQVENPEVVVRDIYVILLQHTLPTGHTTSTYQSLTCAKPTFGVGILVVLGFILPTCVVQSFMRQICIWPISSVPN